MKKIFIFIVLLFLSSAYAQHIERNAEIRYLNFIKIECEKDPLLYHSDGTTLLIEAVRENYYSSVDYILSKKEFIGQINDSWEQFAPPLFWALQNGNKEIAELLLRNGADPNFKTKYDGYAYEYFDGFVENKRITTETAIELKQLLADYGYQKKSPSLVKIGDTLTVKENLRLRENEQTLSQIITTLQKGSPVKVMLLGKYETIDGIDNRWLYVEIQQDAKDRDGNLLIAGKKGWCYGGYLE